MNLNNTDTIAAVATPPGKGGVGIIRLSGPNASDVAHQILGYHPNPRHAHYGAFYDEVKNEIDFGIALFFPGPHSFTGEDVIELQGHGGPVIMDTLLNQALKYGARLARPGEFSERAFLNDKIDLTQAEAIADLIEAESTEAAKSALNSLQGAFSKHINDLVNQVIHLRTYVEAAIDFPDEEIDFLSEGNVEKQVKNILTKIEHTLAQAKQGSILKEGIKVVIAGRPNAGKSSLLNALSGRDSAIVTDIAGTTRDVLKEHIHIEGVPLHIVDTAGLHESADIVEQEGIKRARAEINDADHILLVSDIQETAKHLDQLQDSFPKHIPITVIKNKIDLTEKQPTIEKQDRTHHIIYLSAKAQKGIEILTEHLLTSIGYERQTEGLFTARRRHLDALGKAQSHIQQGLKILQTDHAGELLADDLHQAQQALSEITGRFTSDDLLGEIFSSFCIGK